MPAIATARTHSSQRSVLILLGVTLNSGILAISRLLGSGISSLTVDFWVFVALANAFCLGDLFGQATESNTVCGIDRDKGSLRFCAGTGILILLIFATAPLTASETTALQIVIAAPTILAGALLRYLAMATLGEHFVSESTRFAEQRIVRSGVYSILRHPSECGTLLATLGAVIFFPSFWVIGIWTIALLPLVIYRIHREDRWLLSAFGGEYEAYVRTTWWL